MTHSIIRVCTWLFLCVMLSIKATAQDSSNTNSYSLFRSGYLRIDPGIGIGLDYGGIGIKAEIVLAEWLGIFGGFGYNFVNPAYNTGVSFKLMPQKKATPVILAMYGYNAGLKIKTVGIFGETELLRKTYYGLTIGAGAEIRYGKNGSKASISLLVPFRNKEFHDTYNDFKNRGYKFNPPILPIAISIGCMFSISNR